jgi:hypothetical protein
MSALAGTTLLWRGTSLDRIWALNPTAYRQLAPFGTTVGTLFLLLSGALSVAGVGWLRRRYWGWVLAVVITATQVLGDFVNLIRGDRVRGGIGFAIASALLTYLLSSKLKAIFATSQASSR